MRKDWTIARLRIGDLNKFFALRYGDRTYEFPNDDAGHQDLEILVQHCMVSSPHKVGMTIKARAPWMEAPDVQALIDQIDAKPKRYKSVQLGQMLNFTGKEWKMLRLRTISPVDMTPQERRQYSRAAYRDRVRAKKRQQGVVPRSEWLATNNTEKAKPWTALGISRRTWYRRSTDIEDKLRTPAENTATWHHALSALDSIIAGP
jgi:hypothetical protein